MMLQANDIFPSLDFPRAGGGEIHLPADLAGGFGVVLFYRGAWSEVCVAQLDDFSRDADRLLSEGIRIVSISADKREISEALVESHKLAFPVAYCTDVRAVSAVTGVPINEDGVYFEATGFIVDPEGRIQFAVYSTYDAVDDRIVTAISSSVPITRLYPDDVLNLVRHVKSPKR